MYTELIDGLHSALHGRLIIDLCACMPARLTDCLRASVLVSVLACKCACLIAMILDRLFACLHVARWRCAGVHVDMLHAEGEGTGEARRGGREGWVGGGDGLGGGEGLGGDGLGGGGLA